jgi:hypothetical protein
MGRVVVPGIRLAAGMPAGLDPPTDQPQLSIWRAKVDPILDRPRKRRIEARPIAAWPQMQRVKARPTQTRLVALRKKPVAGVGATAGRESDRVLRTSCSLALLKK